MPKGKKGPDTRAAQIALALRRAFEEGEPPKLARLEREVNMVVRHGSAAEAALTFAKIPAEKKYAQVRMTLLCRVLLLPEFHLLTPWYTDKFEKMKFLPQEHDALAAYCATNHVALEYIDSRQLMH